MHSLISFSLIALLTLPYASAAAQTQSGAIKKWIDEHGIVHYGSVVPPRYRDTAHSELNTQGIEIRRHERAKSAEEIEREKALEALRAEQRKLLEEQQARDRILLSLYRNEDDLIMARDGKLSQLDGLIRLSHAEIRRLKTRLSDFQSGAAAAERTGQRLSEQQQANLDSAQRSIERSYAMILAKEDERRLIIANYAADLERFRQLRQGPRLTADALEVADSEFPDLVDTVVLCHEPGECARLWLAAQAYAVQYATTPVDLRAERILVTAPPRDLRDISITVSRLEDPAGGAERVFMDVQCAIFTEGREFCRGPVVNAIREGFRPALTLARQAP